MPFTLSHAAAVLPLRKVGFVTSAFVVGTFGPDLEYFFLVGPGGRFAHSWPGVAWFTFPMSLLVLFVFHSFLKRPAASLLPTKVEQRLAPYLGKFRFGGLQRFAWICISIAAGIASHILWDSFTHKPTWATRQWPILLEKIPVPVLGSLPLFKALQHASTVLGMAALAIWVLLWLREQDAPRVAVRNKLRPLHKVVIVFAMTAFAAVGALLRTFSSLPLPSSTRGTAQFVVVAGVTGIAYFMLALMTYAAWWRWTERTE